MARKTSSHRRSNNKIPKRPRDEKKKRGKEGDGDTLSKVVNDCKGHEPDCQCYLRKGIFLPPGLDEEEIVVQGSEQKS